MTWFQKDVQKREFDSTGVYRTINYAFANPNSSGNTQVVAAQASLRIVVLQVCVIVSNAVSVKFQSNATDISAQWPLSANGGFVLPYSRHGWFQTGVGEALNVNLNGAIQSAVQITWIQSA